MDACGGGVLLAAAGVQALEPDGDKEATCTPPKGAHVQEEDAEDGAHLSRYVSWLTCESDKPSWSIPVSPGLIQLVSLIY